MAAEQQSLDQSVVEAAIDEACAFTVEKYFCKQQGQISNLSLVRANNESHLPSILEFLKGDTATDPRHYSNKECAITNKTSQWNTRACRFDVPNFFGVILLQQPESGSSSKCLQVLGLATFYLAYSTWDGRVFYLDKLLLSSKNSSDREAWEWSLQYTLADIALRIQCARYTWQHYVPCPRYPSGETVQPETLHGWLTLHRPYDDPLNNNQNAANKKWSLDSDREAIQSCLNRRFTTTTSSDQHQLKVRLATVGDLATIERLVMALAEFEKEPESVHVTREHYRRDGFGEEAPLFHCFLISSSGEDEPVCGMAFCYFGYAFGEGRFLYLEDLFLEEKSRGKGAGSLVMQVLAEVAQSTSCVRMVWQALDWNTPALQFYDRKIGAKVQDGLLTSRFAGTDLSKFCETRQAGNY